MMAGLFGYHLAGEMGSGMTKKNWNKTHQNPVDWLCLPIVGLLLNLFLDLGG